MDGQMRLCLKVGRQGYNWRFLTTFDYTIMIRDRPIIDPADYRRRYSVF